MSKNILLHKKQKVIVWGIESDAVNSEVLIVRYSYLRSNGRIGKERVKHLFEDDYGVEFRSTGQQISIHWQ